MTHRQMSVIMNKLQRGKTWPVVEGYKNVNVCSSSATWKALSPFYLGPVKIDDIVCYNLENLWQQSKVFEDEDDGGMPNELFFKNRRWGFNQKRAMRHKRKKVEVEKRREGRNDEGASESVSESARTIVKVRPQPLYSYWKGRTYSYLQARVMIYIPYYVALAERTEEYSRLKRMVDSGERLQLLGYDGYECEDYEAALLDSSRPFGHEMVLACMLMDNRVWERQTVLNHLGIESLPTVPLSELEFEIEEVDMRCCGVYKSGAKKGQRCTNGGKVERDGSWYCGVHK